MTTHIGSRWRQALLLSCIGAFSMRTSGCSSILGCDGSDKASETFEADVTQEQLDDADYGDSGVPADQQCELLCYAIASSQLWDSIGGTSECTLELFPDGPDTAGSVGTVSCLVDFLDKVCK